MPGADRTGARYSGLPAAAGQEVPRAIGALQLRPGLVAEVEREDRIVVIEGLEWHSREFMLVYVRKIRAKSTGRNIEVELLYQRSL